MLRKCCKDLGTKANVRRVLLFFLYSGIPDKTSITGLDLISKLPLKGIDLHFLLITLKE